MRSTISKIQTTQLPGQVVAEILTINQILSVFFDGANPNEYDEILNRMLCPNQSVVNSNITIANAVASVFELSKSPRSLNELKGACNG